MGGEAREERTGKRWVGEEKKINVRGIWRRDEGRVGREGKGEDGNVRKGFTKEGKDKAE